GELAVDRDGEAFIGGPLGVRERAAAVAETREARLQMERHRVINLVADAVLVEVPLERVALGRPDDELVEDVPVARRLLRQRERPGQLRVLEQAAGALEIGR